MSFNDSFKSHHNLSLASLSDGRSEYKWQSLFLNNHGTYFKKTKNAYITREDVLLVLFKCGLEPSLNRLNELMEDLSKTPVASLCPEKERILYRFFQSEYYAYEEVKSSLDNWDSSFFCPKNAFKLWSRGSYALQMFFSLITGTLPFQVSRFIPRYSPRQESIHALYRSTVGPLTTLVTVLNVITLVMTLEMRDKEAILDCILNMTPWFVALLAQSSRESFWYSKCGYGLTQATYELYCLNYNIFESPFTKTESGGNSGSNQISLAEIWEILSKKNAPGLLTIIGRRPYFFYRYTEDGEDQDDEENSSSSARSNDSGRSNNVIRVSPTSAIKDSSSNPSLKSSNRRLKRGMTMKKKISLISKSQLRRGSITADDVVRKKELQQNDVNSKYSLMNTSFLLNVYAVIRGSFPIILNMLLHNVYEITLSDGMAFLSIFVSTICTIQILIVNAFKTTNECKRMSKDFVDLFTIEMTSPKEKKTIFLSSRKNIESFYRLHQSLSSNLLKKELGYHMCSIQVLFFITVSALGLLVYQTTFYKLEYELSRASLYLLLDGTTIGLAMLHILNNMKKTHENMNTKIVNSLKRQVLQYEFISQNDAESFGDRILFLERVISEIQLSTRPTKLFGLMNIDGNNLGRLSAAMFCSIGASVLKMGLTE